MKHFLVMLGLLVLAGFAHAGNYGYRSYGYSSYSYPSYSSYSYPSYSTYSVPRYYDVPVYKNVYREYPIYVPLATYATLYFGPQSQVAYDAAVKASVAATAATNTATAAVSASQTATSTANATSQKLTAIQGDVRSVLGAVKDLTTIVSNVQSKVTTLEGRMNQIDARLQKVEGGGVVIPKDRPAPAPKGNPAPAPASGTRDEVVIPNHLLVLKNRCASCHQEGGVTKGKLALFDADGKLAPLSGDQIAAMTEHVTKGTMPPAKDSAGKAIQPLSEAETISILTNMSKFPRKTSIKENGDESIRLDIPGSKPPSGSAPVRRVGFARFRKQR